MLCYVILYYVLLFNRFVFLTFFRVIASWPHVINVMKNTFLHASDFRVEDNLNHRTGGKQRVETVVHIK